MRPRMLVRCCRADESFQLHCIESNRVRLCVEKDPCCAPRASFKTSCRYLRDLSDCVVEYEMPLSGTGRSERRQCETFCWRLRCCRRWSILQTVHAVWSATVQWFLRYYVTMADARRALCLQSFQMTSARRADATNLLFLPLAPGIGELLTRSVHCKAISPVTERLFYHP